MYTFISFLPEFVFFLYIFIIFIFCIIYALSSILKYPNIYINTIYLSILSLSYTFLLFLNNIVSYLDYSIINKTQNNLMVSELLIIFCIVILISTIYFNSYFELNSFEFIIFILISIGSLFIFLNVLHFILIYIILELQSILISILISLNKYNRYSVEASIKYFILGSFSSLLLLFGFSLIYGSTGLLSINDISLFFVFFENIKNDLVFMSIHISTIFILIGTLFKIYSAPFHFWVPDIYEGSATSVLIYISTVQLLVMVFFFLKIYYYLLFDIFYLKQYIIGILSVFTLLFGSIGALLQKKLKKLISFSAITMNGFFLYSIVHNNTFLLETSMMYLLVYLCTTLSLFIIIVNLFINNNVIVKLSDLFNIYSNNKTIANIFTILLFSISGIPPFIGFISKIFWLKSLIVEYSIFIFFLLFIFLIVSYYYIRLVKNMYYLVNTSTSNVLYFKTIPYESCIILIFIQILLLVSVFYSFIFYNFIKSVLLCFVLSF